MPRNPRKTLRTKQIGELGSETDEIPGSRRLVFFCAKGLGVEGVGFRGLGSKV